MKFFIAIIVFIFLVVLIFCLYSKNKFGIKPLPVYLPLALLISLLIAYYDMPMKWEFYGVKFQTMKNDIQNANSNAERALEIAKQVEKNLDNANLIAKNANLIALEANQISKKVEDKLNEANIIQEEENIIVSEMKVQSEKFGAIQAINTFRIIEKDYMDLDIEISNWEKSKNIIRESDTPSSEEDFNDLLDKIVKEYAMPDEIKYKYIERNRLRTIMKDVRDSYLPYANQFASMNIDLPALPDPIKLPRSAIAVFSPSGSTVISSPQGGKMIAQ